MAKTLQGNGHERQVPETLPASNGPARGETLSDVAARMSQTKDGETIGSRYDYAAHTVVFGNGQFPHVLAHYEIQDQAVLDCMKQHPLVAKAVTALMLDIARGAANNMIDDDYGAIVAKAEKAMADALAAPQGIVMPSGLDEAIDDYFYRIQKMSREDKKAQGVTANLGGLTSFADRMVLTNGVVTWPNETGKSVRDNGADRAIVPDGYPSAGSLWTDVVGESIRTYCAETRPDNKKSAKEGTAAKPKATGNAATNLLA